MRLILVCLISTLAAATSVSKAWATGPLTQTAFSDCAIQSGPDLVGSLKIPNELLQSNWKSLNSTGNRVDTYFNLKLDPKTQKLSISENQEFDDIAQTNEDVIIQLGEFGKKVYGSIETKAGSSYALFQTQPAADVKMISAEVDMQHVNQGKGVYADLRLSCVYRK